MRAYFFGNMYLSSIQQGIQAAHVVAEMFTLYAPLSGVVDEVKNESKMLHEWATEHKTMILLNGGYSSSIEELYNFLNVEENPYPFQIFKEEKDSINSATTCVGIILPEKIYTTANLLRKHRVDTTDIPSPRSQIKNHKSLSIPPYPRNYWGLRNTEAIYWTYTDFEFELCEKLNEFDLAR